MNIDAVIEELKHNEESLRFRRLKAICDHFFGKPRIRGAHHIYATGIPEFPLVNIQNNKGKAKPYQVRQVRKVLETIRDRGKK
ncbi:MAG: toxin HicA [Acidobacteria bacterium]|nr:toxin HicA [Acidobacteriota bacterium]